MEEPTSEENSSSSLLEHTRVSSTTKANEGSVVFTLFSTAVAAMGPFAFGYTLGYTSPALLDMTRDISMTTAQASVFSAIVNVGAMIGAASGGGLADQWGRKVALALAALPFLIGWTCIAFSSEILVLCFGRLLTGFGTGVVSFAVPVYIAEISPGSLRGSLGAMNQFAITAGILLVYALGLAFHWRTLAIIGTLPPTFLLLGLTVVPESPRWIARHDPTALLRVLRRLRGAHADVSAEASEIEGTVALSAGEPKAGLRDLAEPTLRLPLLVSIGLMFCQQLSGVNAVMFFAGSIFKAAGFADPNVPGFIVQAVQVVMTGVAAGLMDKAGRRFFLMLSATGLAVGSFFLGLSFYFQNFPPSTLCASLSHPMALLSLLLYIVSFSMGMGAIPWIIMSEIFPAHVRGVAGSLAVLINWMCCFFVTLTFGYLLQWSAMGAFWLYSGECVATVLFVAFIVPETRGKSLEQIQSLFKST